MITLVFVIYLPYNYQYSFKLKLALWFCSNSSLKLCLDPGHFLLHPIKWKYSRWLCIILYTFPPKQNQLESLIWYLWKLVGKKLNPLLWVWVILGWVGDSVQKYQHLLSKTNISWTSRPNVTEGWHLCRAGRAGSGPRQGGVRERNEIQNTPP